MADKSDKKKKQEETAEQPSGPAPTPRLFTMYQDEIRPKLAKEFGLTNPMQHPRLEAIVVNVNMGRHLEGTKVPQNVKQTIHDTLVTITGQRPVVLKAKKSVSNFKVRAGYDTAQMVTLRRNLMWNFLDRFINLATPRIKDFRGLKDTSFDRQGNYSCGLSEQGVFPEIDMGKVTFTHGMNINLCFSRSTPEMSKFILKELGMPFVRVEEQQAA